MTDNFEEVTDTELLDWLSELLNPRDWKTRSVSFRSEMYKGAPRYRVGDAGWAESPRAAIEKHYLRAVEKQLLLEDAKT